MSNDKDAATEFPDVIGLTPSDMQKSAATLLGMRGPHPEAAERLRNLLDKLPTVDMDAYFKGYGNVVDTLLASAIEQRTEINQLRADAERYRWLMGDCDGDAQDDLIQWLARTVESKDSIDARIDAAMAAGGANG